MLASVAYRNVFVWMLSLNRPSSRDCINVFAVLLEEQGAHDSHRDAQVMPIIIHDGGVQFAFNTQFQSTMLLEERSTTGMSMEVVFFWTCDVHVEVLTRLQPYELIHKHR